MWGCSDGPAAGLPHRSWHDQSQEEATPSQDEPTFQDENATGHYIWGTVESANTDSSSMSYSGSGNTYSGSGNKKEKHHVPSNVQFLSMSECSSTKHSSDTPSGDQTNKALGLETSELVPRYDNVNVVDKPVEAVYKKELKERKDSRVLPPSDQLEDLPSVGSAKHFSNTCKPCVYVQAGRNCIKGKNCFWCHLSHDGQQMSPSFRKNPLKKKGIKNATGPKMDSMDQPSTAGEGHSQRQVLIDELRSTHSGPDSPDSYANTCTQASATGGSTGSIQPSCPRPCVPEQEKAQGASRPARSWKASIASLFGGSQSDKKHAEDDGQAAEVCTVCNGDPAEPCASCMSVAKKTKTRNRPSKKTRDRQKAYGIGPYAAPALQTPVE